MSSLHSCHWDWCRFTTVLHDDFVEHVVSTHLDKAEPVKRVDISLIHRVEQGTSGHSDSSVGGILGTEAAGAQSEALESTETHLAPSRPDYTKTALSFTSGSTYILPLSQQKHQTTASDGSSVDISQFNPQTQAEYKSQSFD